MHSTFRKEKHGWAELFQTWAPTLQEVCFHHSISEWWSHYRHGEACFLTLCFVEEIYTPPKTNTSPEKWWLEDECPLKMVPFLRDIHSLSGVYTTNVRTWVSIVILDVAPGDLVFIEKSSLPTKNHPFEKTRPCFFCTKNTTWQAGSSRKLVPACSVKLQMFFVFTRIPGEMIQFEEHIFQMGWFNHQLEFGTGLLESSKLCVFFVQGGDFQL